MDFRNWLLVEELFANNSATIYHRTGKSGDNPQKSVEGMTNYHQVCLVMEDILSR